MKAIALQVIKTNDKGGVARLFTSDHGLRAYYVSLGKKQHYFQSLSLLEVHEREQRKSSMSRLSEVSRAIMTPHLSCEPARAAVSMFVAEVLNQCLAEGERHAALFEYCWHTIQLMDLDSHIGVYPQLFLGRILRHLGHLPDVKVVGEHAVLDMVSGDWVKQLPGHGRFLNETLSGAFVQAGWSSAALFSNALPDRADRRELLKQQIAFIKTHLTGDREIKSFSILTEVFA